MEAAIYHIVPARDWEQAAEPYASASLQAEGFIHCSAAEQVPRVAAALFAGRTDLLLVEIDPGHLEVPVRWEDCYETGEEFPHIYGPLPRDAVVDIRVYVPDQRGRFPDPAEPCGPSRPAGTVRHQLPGEADTVRWSPERRWPRA